jgi:chromosome segregation ATPase
MFYALLSQPTLEDIKKHEPLYEKIMKDAKEILEDTEESPERESLMKEVSDIENRWNNVVAHAETRDHELAQVVPEAKRCQTKVQSLEPKVVDLETKLQALPGISVDPDVLKKQAKDAEHLRKDVEDLATLNDEMNDSCNTLVGNSLADLYLVAAEVENLKTRYGAILDKASDWQNKLNTVNEQVNQYNEMKKPVEETVVNVEESIPVHDSPVTDAESAKSELQTVEKSIEKLDALRPEKANVIKIGSGILMEVGEESPKVVVLKEGKSVWLSCESD